MRPLDDGAQVPRAIRAVGAQPVAESHNLAAADEEQQPVRAHPVIVERDTHVLETDLGARLPYHVALHRGSGLVSRLSQDGRLPASVPSKTGNYVKATP